MPGSRTPSPSSLSRDAARLCVVGQDASGGLWPGRQRAPGACQKPLGCSCSALTCSRQGPRAEEGRGDDLWPPLLCGGLTVPVPWHISQLWKKCLDLDMNSRLSCCPA